MTTKTCLSCKAEFSTDNNRQRLCFECKAKRQTEPQTKVPAVTTQGRSVVDQLWEEVKNATLSGQERHAYLSALIALEKELSGRAE